MYTDKRIELVIEGGAKEVLTRAALGNLNNGGRGIGNIVESYLINPLARYLFDNDVYENAQVTIKAINEKASPVALECSFVRNEGE